MEFGLTSVASYWHLHLPQGQASAYKGSSIDHGLSADAIEASAVLQEDSRPQAILKLRPPNSLDYSTRYGCQPILSVYEMSKFSLTVPIFLQPKIEPKEHY